MKFILCVAILLLPLNVCAKMNGNNIYVDKNNNAKILNTCVKNSNINYNHCMINCVSYQSPEYITQLCSKDCNEKVETLFYKCLFK